MAIEGPGSGSPAALGPLPPLPQPDSPGLAADPVGHIEPANDPDAASPTRAGPGLDGAFIVHGKRAAPAPEQCFEPLLTPQTEINQRARALVDALQANDDRAALDAAHGVPKSERDTLAVRRFVNEAARLAGGFDALDGLIDDGLNRSETRLLRDYLHQPDGRASFATRLHNATAPNGTGEQVVNSVYDDLMRRAGSYETFVQLRDQMEADYMAEYGDAQPMRHTWTGRYYVAESFEGVMVDQELSNEQERRTFRSSRIQGQYALAAYDAMRSGDAPLAALEHAALRFGLDTFRSDFAYVIEGDPNATQALDERVRSELRGADEARARILLDDGLEPASRERAYVTESLRLAAAGEVETDEAVRVIRTLVANGDSAGIPWTELGLSAAEVAALRNRGDPLLETIVGGLATNGRVSAQAQLVATHHSLAARLPESSAELARFVEGLDPDQRFALDESGVLDTPLSFDDAALAERYRLAVGTDGTPPDSVDVAANVLHSFQRGAATSAEASRVLASLTPFGRSQLEARYNERFSSSTDETPFDSMIGTFEGPSRDMFRLALEAPPPGADAQAHEDYLRRFEATVRAQRNGGLHEAAMDAFGLAGIELDDALRELRQTVQVAAARESRGEPIGADDRRAIHLAEARLSDALYNYYAEQDELGEAAGNYAMIAAGVLTMGAASAAGLGLYASYSATVAAGGASHVVGHASFESEYSPNDGARDFAKGAAWEAVGLGVGVAAIAGGRSVLRFLGSR